MNRTFVSLAVLSLALLPGLAKAGTPTTYDVAAIPTLGGSRSEAYKINNNGQVTGVASVTSGLYNAYLWSPAGGIVGLGNLGFGNSFGYGLNNAGDVVGQASFVGGNRAILSPSGASVTNFGNTLGNFASAAWGINTQGNIAGFTRAPGGTHAFLYTKSSNTTQDLGTLAGIGVSYASALNDQDQVAGYGHTAQYAFHAFRWAAGSMQDLGTLGGTTSFAYDINSNGDVVGTAQLAGDAAKHAFLWTATGGMQDVGTLGGSSSTAYGVNSAGDVVGESTTATGGTAAFIRPAGSQPINLNTLLPVGSGWVLISARSINNNGQIVGIGNQGGQIRGFVLTPQGAANRAR